MPVGDGLDDEAEPEPIKDVSACIAELEVEQQAAKLDGLIVVRLWRDGGLTIKAYGQVGRYSVAMAACLMQHDAVNGTYGDDAGQ